MSHESDMEACTQAGAICDEHKRFEPFVGTFKAQAKIWMGPGEPNVSTGTMTNTLDLGGRFIAQTYKGDDTDGPFPNFEGRGFFGYNTITRQFEGIWIDNCSTTFETEIGAVDASGRVWTMIGQVPNPQTGQQMTKRSVIRVQDNDHHSKEMFFQGPDGSEFKAMEIQYTRA